MTKKDILKEFHNGWNNNGDLDQIEHFISSSIDKILEEIVPEESDNDKRSLGIGDYLATWEDCRSDIINKINKIKGI